MASATGSYGLMQTYGYRASSVVWQTGSIAAGIPLVPTDAANYLQSAATSTTSNADVILRPFYAVCLQSVASSAASTTISKKIFIRAMGFVPAVIGFSALLGA